MSETAVQESREGSPDPIATPKRAQVMWELIRIAVGWTFLWAFVDKLFGLGAATCEKGVNDAGESVGGVMCDDAFLSGGSVTFGILEFATAGSKTGDLFSWMASSGPYSQNVVDWLFMFGIGAIGISLTFGFLVRLGAVACFVMYIFMYLAIAVWPANNLFWDDHLLGALLAVGLIFGNAGATLGLGPWWRKVVDGKPLLD